MSLRPLLRQAYSLIYKHFVIFFYFFSFYPFHDAPAILYPDSMRTVQHIKATPAKHPFSLPTQALAEAIDREWEGKKKFIISEMPMTSLAFTAIDRIATQKDAIIEALLVFADTDTLCYRAPEEPLQSRQKEHWDVVLGWSSLMLGVKWQVVESIMPLEQETALHAALEKYLASKDEWELAAFTVLASCFSSLVLAKAVVEGHLSAAEAYHLSRLEENFNDEQWGEDAEAKKRAARIEAEALHAGEFLKQLKEK